MDFVNTARRLIGRNVVDTDVAVGPSSYSTAVLSGLQAKHVYAGTVPPAVVARRRAANKVARRSRRRNRTA